VKTQNKYYKGNLLCQFQTVNTQKVGNSTVYTSQSQITLEPRFRYEDVEEITEEEYVNLTAQGALPFIKQAKPGDVEFSFLHETDVEHSSMIKRIDELVLVLNKAGGSRGDISSNGLTTPVNNYITPQPNDQQQALYYSPFDAVYGKASHGKLKGLAFCKEVQLLDEKEKPLNISQLNDVAAEQAIKQFSTSPVGQLAQLTGVPIVPNAVIQKSGCFGRKNNNGVIIPGISAPQTNRGCFGFGMPGIQQNAGCLFPFLLLLLAGLLWWLLGMRGCRDNNNVAPIIIHDTIRVEVQKIDTLMIVKTDTVSYIDSTTKLNYETVNLPNVQFITSSDVLLPSSAIDLQKLAEYLIKNDSLNATIYGHTDNVGKSEENLKLSQRRAESVKRFLGSLGVDSKRLNAVGKGDTEPKADNNLEEGRLINRRVEVQLTNTEFVTTKRTKLELTPEDANNKEKKKNQP
jgi:outer membrane protein OmpA-like peptidoglycan-associated protein